ncbi:MAG: DNA translocase FtsK [Candidatus Zixiibacteriota bacterium]
MAAKKKSSHKGRKTIGLILILLAAFVLVALITHLPMDDSRIQGQVDAQVKVFDLHIGNKAGLLGAYVSYLLFVLMGWLAFFIPVGLVSIALNLLSEEFAQKYKIRAVFLFVIALCATIMANVHAVTAISDTNYPDFIGGYIGEMLSRLFVRIVGDLGAYIILGGIIVILLVLYTVITPFLLGRLRKTNVAPLKKAAKSPIGWFKSLSALWPFGKKQETDDSDEPAPEVERSVRAAISRAVDTAEQEEPVRSQADLFDDGSEKSTKRRSTLKKAAEPIHISNFNYKYPGTDLLDAVENPGPSVSTEELNATSKMLKDTLEIFGVTIEGNIDRYPGPIITRYEFKPGVGIKVNQIVNLSDDLALALKARQIRIIAPIPGKAAVGIEIPNRLPQKVFLREILESDEFKDPRIRLPLAFGKTTSGKPFIADLARMPHLLIAGATGSGKSVCMNVLITSLVYRMHPMQIRFIFVDPKMLELSVYQGLPQLGRPVVTTARQAEKVFADAVVEMENRYRRLATAAVRNIEDFNRKQAKEEDKLPYIIIFVDELADLMMSSQSARSEMLITRLAQMARAVGIHLVLATQRPSVDVITGLIKANFPARIAFQVASKVDSRTIIDANGAEKLLGNGDMLFLSTGQPEPTRIHGAYLSSDETDRIVASIRDQKLPMLTLQGITQTTAEAAENEGVDMGDPLFREACEVVVRHKQGSVSLLQRRLGIGYQRAARLIDKLEEAGIVSPFDGSKAREVIVDKNYLDTLFGPAANAGKAESTQN